MNYELFKNGGHFPNETQTLLLKSALSDPNIGFSYFLRWLEINGLDDLDTENDSFLSFFFDSLDIGSQRLIPLVTYNLKMSGHRYLDRFKGYQKNIWVKNQRTFLETASLIKFLNDIEIPNMIIKGISLASRYYPKIECRPMADGDLLIPFSDRKKVLNLIREGKTSMSLKKWVYEWVDFDHAVHLEGLNGVDVDLHWNLFTEYGQVPHSTNFAWEKAEDFSWAGVHTKVLNSTDEFFLALVHGRHFDLVPPIRWVADCVLVNRKVEIDWDRFEYLSRTFHFKPFVQKSIAYLEREFEILLPESNLSRIMSQKTLVLEKEYYRLLSINIHKNGFWSLLYLGTKRRMINIKLFQGKTLIESIGYLIKWYIQKIKFFYMRMKSSNG